jgi:hypothetical protein
MCLCPALLAGASCAVSSQSAAPPPSPGLEAPEVSTRQSSAAAFTIGVKSSSNGCGKVFFIRVMTHRVYNCCCDSVVVSHRVSHQPVGRQQLRPCKRPDGKDSRVFTSFTHVVEGMKIQTPPHLTLPTSQVNFLLLAGWGALIANSLACIPAGV